MDDYSVEARGISVSPASVAERLVGPGYEACAVRSLRDLRRLVEEGLPVEALEMVTSYLMSDPSEAARIRHAIVPRTTLRRRSRLTPEESARTERLARLVTLAEEVWEDRVHAREFVLSPQPQLGGEIPLEMAMSELGYREVEELLMRIEYSLPS